MGLSDGEDGENSKNLEIALAPVFEDSLLKHPPFLPSDRKTRGRLFSAGADRRLITNRLSNPANKEELMQSISFSNISSFYLGEYKNNVALCSLLSQSW
jgi:hypothetical protein